jgi:translation initiation factor 3 subunit I
MIPILLQGHTRSLTDLTYNSTGDLLVTAAKDNSPNVWWCHNGERLGTLNGHIGTVWSVDISGDSSIVISGSADNTARIWDLQTGKCMHVLTFDTAVRSVDFSMGDRQVVLVTDATMGKRSNIFIFDVNNPQTPVLQVEASQEASKKATVCAWSDCNEHIITGHNNGDLCLWEPKTGGILTQKSGAAAHSDAIRDIQFSADKSYFITASKDQTAKIFDADSLECHKVFRTERPVNSASISPIRDEVIIAGGQEALHVTTTSGRAGQFEARFFHPALETEIGRVKGHFGPINTVMYHPAGRGFASGAEDGYVRLHTFDPDYFEFMP